MKNGLTMLILSGMRIVSARSVSYTHLDVYKRQDYTTDGHTVWKDDKQRIIDLHCFEFTDDGIVYEGDI